MSEAAEDVTVAVQSVWPLEGSDNDAVLPDDFASVVFVDDGADASVTAAGGSGTGGGALTWGCGTPLAEAAPVRLLKPQTGRRCELHVAFSGTREILAVEVVSSARIIEVYGSAEEPGDCYWMSCRAKEPLAAGTWHCPALLTLEGSRRATAAPLVIKLFSLSAPAARCTLHGVRLHCRRGAAAPAAKARTLGAGAAAAAEQKQPSIPEMMALAARFLGGGAGIGGGGGAAAIPPPFAAAAAAAMGGGGGSGGGLPFAMPAMSAAAAAAAAGPSAASATPQVSKQVEALAAEVAAMRAERAADKAARQALEEEVRALRQDLEQQKAEARRRAAAEDAAAVAAAPKRHLRERSKSVSSVRVEPKQLYQAKHFFGFTSNVEFKEWLEKAAHGTPPSSVHTSPATPPLAAKQASSMGSIDPNSGLLTPEKVAGRDREASLNPPSPVTEAAAAAEAGGASAAKRSPEVRGVMACQRVSSGSGGGSPVSPSL